MDGRHRGGRGLPPDHSNDRTAPLPAPLLYLAIRLWGGLTVRPRTQAGELGTPLPVRLGLSHRSSPLTRFTVGSGDEACADVSEKNAVSARAPDHPKGPVKDPSPRRATAWTAFWAGSSGTSFGIVTGVRLVR